MCGIAGFISQASRHKTAAKQKLTAMLQCMAHRGPDGQGIWLESNVGLAHRRLSIIDLDPRAAQPMRDASGRYAITFNGEIYNYRELRQQLIEKGYHFHTSSDTEVILHGYGEWGTDICTRLDGMFAFALWDSKARQLLLARDRFGKKPLYLSRIGDALVFASELKALRQWPGFDETWNWQALDYYLGYQYIAAPQTIYANTEVFPAAHYALVKPDQAYVLKRFWQLPQADQPQPTRDAPTQILGELRNRFTDACRKRLVADVPVGIWLSGGFDSSAVIAALSHDGIQDIPTFSIGFNGHGVDETPQAESVARLFKTDHRSFQLQPNDLLARLPQLAAVYNQPFADPAALATLALSEETARHVKVVLTGDGGDEAGFGYSRYQALAQLGWLRGMPGIKNILDALPPKLSRRNQIQRLKMLLTAPFIADGYADATAVFTADERQQFWNYDIIDLLTPRSDPQDRVSKGGCTDRLSILRDARLQRAPQDEGVWRKATNFASAANQIDIARYLPDDLLVKVDRASMAYGLEARSPWLDHALFGWLHTLPTGWLMPHGRLKFLLKMAFAPWLPPEIVWRKKQGFELPLHHWLRQELRDVVLALPECAFVQQFGRPEFVRQLVQDFENGKPYQLKLWNLLVLDAWYQAQ